MSPPAGSKAKGAQGPAEPPVFDAPALPDFDAMAQNMGRLVEQAGKAASAWAEPREKGEVRDHVAEPVVDMVKTFSKLSEYWLADPQRALEAPETGKTLALQGTETSGSASPQDFAAFLAEDAKLWARLVKDAGVKPD